MVKNDMKIFLLLALLVTGFIKAINATNFTLNGYTEFGKRSTAVDYEEENYDNDYSYENYHLKFTHIATNNIYYDLRVFFYKKNYNSQDELDNISRIFI